MAQCGWYVWKKSKKFNSLQEMVRGIHQIIESHEDKLGPDGCTLMIGYDIVEGMPILRTITDWDSSVVDQVVPASEIFESLEFLEDRI